MKNKKIASILALLKSPKIFIPLAFLVALGSTAGLVIPLAFNSQSSDVQGLTIDASVNFDLKALQCQHDSNSLVVEIVKPENNKEFLTTDKIDFEGSHEYECEDNPTFEMFWYLDNSEEPFASNSTSSSLEKLSVGEHNVKYLIKSDNIENSAEVKFTVKEPVKVVVNPTPQPQAQKENQPPIVNIDDWFQVEGPSKPSTVQATYPECSSQTIALICNLYTYVTFVGSGIDSEDGSVLGDNLKWSYKLNQGNFVDSSSGDQVNLKLYAPNCNSNQSSNTYTIKLIGFDSEGKPSEEKIVSIIVSNSQYCTY